MPEQPKKPEADRPDPKQGEPAPATGDNSAAPKELTPEEQMALFEKDLQENDWGHQPC